MPHRAARTHSAYCPPPARATDRGSYRTEVENMMDIASMAILARRAAKEEDARKRDMEKVVLKSCLTALLTVRKQKDGRKFKQDKTRYRLVATQARIRYLRDQEREIETELDQVGSCMDELREMPDAKEDEQMYAGGGEPANYGMAAASGPPYAPGGLPGPVGPQAQCMRALRARCASKSRSQRSSLGFSAQGIRQLQRLRGQQAQR
eukprot:6589261-Pyramimonas_sp.AAC.1